MWEQLMQMLQAMPQGGGMTGGPAMGGAAAPVAASAAPTNISTIAGGVKKVGDALTKGMGSMPVQQPPQVATPRAPTPQPYRPDGGGGTPGMGSSAGGDVMQMLMGLPGMQAMLGGGGGGGSPDQMGNIQQPPGAGVPSLGQLMMMSQQRR